MTDLGPTWALIALVLFLGGVFVYTRGLRPNDRRNGRRLMWAAPVWPVLPVVALVWAGHHIVYTARKGHHG